MPTKHLLIKGKVQGVFFRASAKERADELKITGWVRNSDEGDVEIMVNGSKENLEAFANWCWQGPRRAVVHEVIITEQKPLDFHNFSIVR